MPIISMYNVSLKNITIFINKCLNVNLPNYLNVQYLLIIYKTTFRFTNEIRITVHITYLINSIKMK